MALFNGEAEDYDKWYETKIGEHADRVETECALSLFKVEPGMRLLDVGCGTGNFSIKLARQDASVVGVDISREMLVIAEKKQSRKSWILNLKKWMDSIYYFQMKHLMEFYLWLLSSLFRTTLR